ncbi:DUF5133 domain-containing protein [Streptomyces sp. NPDC048442]|uniref:DUF5133 domain-containing protein n=1 Tax=Streptomyces sp. NPDC048442 TaxID=3154823 RepID=UPI003417E237
MITPSPQVLRPLLARYAEARITAKSNPSESVRRTLEDVSYTLCVLTGTSRVEVALEAADLILQPAAAPSDEAVSTTLAA